MIVHENDPLRRPLATLPFTKEGLEDRVPCGMYGCKMPKLKGAPMCHDCLVEQAEDPDAFK